MKLSNSYSKLLVTHSNSYLEMAAATPDGRTEVRKKLKHSLCFINFMIT